MKEGKNIRNTLVWILAYIIFTIALFFYFRPSIATNMNEYAYLDALNEYRRVLLEEKEALAFYLDGKVTAVSGTHTHVQTADEKILPGGTAYITDLGLTGVLDGVIGSREDKAIERVLTQLPIKSEVKEGRAHIQGIIVEADRDTGKAISIKRFTR